jgi:DNA polymerase III alpha subunit
MLEETYGIMVYQEQVNRRSWLFWRRGQCRAKPWVKKTVLKWPRHREIFRKGVNNGLSEEKLTRCFDLMGSLYNGFNKSHSAAYALLVHTQPFRVKVHYPAEFYCHDGGDGRHRRCCASCTADASGKFGISFESPST